MKDTPHYGTGLTNDILWYDKPAGLYTEGLPIGTGRLAAMVFGGVRRERVALNHEWLWRGRHRKRDTADSAAQLPEVRRLLLAERWEEAAKLANDAFGGGGGISGTPNRVDPYSHDHQQPARSSSSGDLPDRWQSRRHGRRSGNAAAKLPRRAAFPACAAVMLADRAGERIARTRRLCRNPRLGSGPVERGKRDLNGRRALHDPQCRSRLVRHRSGRLHR
jgi:hypothetical protein